MTMMTSPPPSQRTKKKRSERTGQKKKTKKKVQRWSSISTNNEEDEEERLVGHRHKIMFRSQTLFRSDSHIYYYLTKPARSVDPTLIDMSPLGGNVFLLLSDT